MSKHTTINVNEDVVTVPRIGIIIGVSSVKIREQKTSLFKRREFNVEIVVCVNKEANLNVGQPFKMLTYPYPGIVIEKFSDNCFEIWFPVHHSPHHIKSEDLIGRVIIQAEEFHYYYLKSFSILNRQTFWMRLKNLFS